MDYKGIYIDDKDQDLAYADLLNINNGKDSLSFEKLKPESLSAFADKIIKRKPDIVVLDYRLDEEVQNQEGYFKAGSLAQRLREILVDIPDHDFPIVLVSTEEKIQNFFMPDKTSHDLFDGWYYKDFINKNGASVSNQILSMAHGYKAIIFNKDNPDWLSALLNIPPEEFFVIENTDINNEFEEGGRPHTIARYFLNYIIRRAGLLLRPSDIYAMLGIKLEDYKNVQPEIWRVLETNGLCYEGIFSAGWSRVWRHRFDHWVREQFGTSITGISLKTRVEKVNEIFSTHFEPAPSLWTQNFDELPSFSCASCLYPTELRNSVAAHDPRLPNFIERKRICFDCLEADRYEKKHLKVSSEDQNILQQIQKQKIPRE